jgi:hypothetical protein
MALLSLRIRHPEPSGSRWATPPSLIQQRPGQSLRLHQYGFGTCGVYTYDMAETRVTQVMDFVRKCQHPLPCVMEKTGFLDKVGHRHQINSR